MKELVQLLGLDPQQRLLLRQQSLVHHLDGNLHGGRARALAVARLQHVQLAFLDGELEILNVLVMMFQPGRNFPQLTVNLRHDLLQLGDGNRSPNARHHVFAFPPQVKRDFDRAPLIPAITEVMARGLRLPPRRLREAVPLEDLHPHRVEELAHLLRQRGAARREEAQPATGAALESDALKDHPAVRRRVDEFWRDHPADEDLRLSGLLEHPWLRREADRAAGEPLLETTDLTAAEFRLLQYFQAHRGAVCSKDALIAAVWPEELHVTGLRDDRLAQLVRRLRLKVEPDPAHPRRIKTVAGRGYLWMG